MECIIFIGIQASGKSTFYQQRFFHTHIRINLDMLKTRHRENILFEACLSAKQPVVIDNTNVSKEYRQRYIGSALDAGFTVTGYYFQSIIRDALARNEQRNITQQVPDIAIMGTAKQLELPSYDEGFTRLYYVSTTADKRFLVEEWQDEQ